MTRTFPGCLFPFCISSITGCSNVLLVLKLSNRIYFTIPRNNCRYVQNGVIKLKFHFSIILFIHILWHKHFQDVYFLSASVALITHFYALSCQKQLVDDVCVTSHIAEKITYIFKSHQTQTISNILFHLYFRFLLP